ncbi:nicotianamine synthase family protein [Alteribacillus sp. HJP-4]|uniref:nicotianamine synthase family protein n=1 Tax=Alteribacillus sp. HJP-4 TaxID=2775394 RepID=UPI0035CD19EF
MLSTRKSLEEHITETYLQAYDTLNEEEDLSPKNPIINQTLTHLVMTLSVPADETISRKVLTHPHIQKIRPQMLALLSEAESAMECYYAMHFLNTARSIDDLTHFIYWNNYKSLIAKEFSIGREIVKPKRITMIGSGPLPITAILMAERWNIPVRCLDIDPFSHLLGKQLLSSLDCSAQLEHEQNDGAIADYEHDDLTFIASLVPDKEKIIRRIAQSNADGAIAIRSAEGLHRLLYEPVDPLEYKVAGYNYINATKADSDSINTTIFIK